MHTSMTADPWNDKMENSTMKAEGTGNAEGTFHMDAWHASFEDNFADKKFQKLADSSEYLSVLERKLSRVKGLSSRSASQDLVRGITALRQDRMGQFLSGKTTSASHNSDDSISSANSQISTDSEFNSQFGTIGSDPLYSSWLAQRIFPDRQALSQEELAALLHFDALAVLNDQMSENRPNDYGVLLREDPSKS